MEQLKTMTDEQLAIKYMEGNNQAFDILLSRNQNKLFAYILFVVHDEGLANDVFQETFVKIIVKLQNGLYEPSGLFAAWCMRIAHNVIMDTFRRQKHAISWSPTRIMTSANCVTAKSGRATEREDTSTNRCSET